MTRQLAATAVMAVAVGFAIAPAAAVAHGETSPLILSVVDEVEPETAGISFTPVRGVAALLEVSNTTRDTVELLSPSGEPFLRVGPGGAYGNARSEYWRASGNPDGRPPSRPAPRGRGALWVLASREPRWAYYEHRLHPNQVRLPADAKGSREIIRLRDWEVPFRIAGRPARMEGHIEFRPVLGRATSELTSSAQPLPGVVVALLQGRFPGVLLQTSRRDTVVVKGRAGEPFARVGPEGVEVNLRSPTRVEDRRARGEAPEAVADPKAAPLWRKVSDTPSFTWLESRARYAREQPPDHIVRRGEPARLTGWTIPLEAGRRTVEVQGTTTWVPEGPDGLPSRPRLETGDATGALPWVAAALALLGAAGALVLRVGRARA